MVFVPGGTFWMGSAAGEGDADERPRHRVTLSGYCMDRTEATMSTYQACVAAGACTAASTGGDCNAGVAGRENHPANCIDWEQSVAYCRWRGATLPTEAQWEYAASGGGTRRYPWGNTAPDGQLCWRQSRTCEVGAYPASASREGILDLAGNVWEWTSDWYSAYTATQGPSVQNPTGAATGTARVYRVYRGGSWDDYDPARVRARVRGCDAPARLRGGPRAKRENFLSLKSG